MINYWQRGVPVYDEPYLTRPFVVLSGFAVIGLALATARMMASLGPFSGMNDFYAWGIWKTFNVMTLTALGSGALSVGIAAWVLNHRQLHVVMRVALVTSLLFYGTGLLALVVDVGRPWNMWQLFTPWRWNGHSSLLEVAVCMPAYAFLFLAFENLPYVLERFWYRGSPSTRVRLKRWETHLRKIYPFMIAGAYVLPAMHQSSLGALLLLAGDKVDPLWQSQMLPAFYLIQAGICGFAMVIVVLMASCLRWQRPLDLSVLDDLAGLMSWLIFVFLGARWVDILVRGQVQHAFDLQFFSLLFLAENFAVLVPAVVLRFESMRRTPRVLFNMAVLAGIGGMLYRFIPTTIAYDPGPHVQYFPSVPEVVITIGFISLAVVAYAFAVKTFAILPAPLSSWYDMVERTKRLHPDWRLDRYGNPIDD